MNLATRIVCGLVGAAAVLTVINLNAPDNSAIAECRAATDKANAYLAESKLTDNEDFSLAEHLRMLEPCDKL